MKLSILLLLLLLPGLVVAQLRRAERLLFKGKFEQCIRLAEKSKFKKKKDRLAYEYILCKAFTGQYQENPQSNTAALDKAMTYYRSVYKSNTQKDFTQFSDTFYTLIQNHALQLIDNKKTQQSKVYVKFLASIFKDTLDAYASLFPEKQKVILAKNETNALPVSSVKLNKTDIRKKLIKTGEEFLGIRYKWAGIDSGGLDCSGFVMKSMSKCGIKLSHSATEQSLKGNTVEPENVQPGDLVFFGSVNEKGKTKIQHVGMVHHIDKGEIYIIHCTSQGVIVQTFEKDSYWGRRLLFYKNIIDTVL